MRKHRGGDRTHTDFRSAARLTIAVDLVEANLAGRDSHGVVRGAPHLAWLRVGVERQRARDAVVGGVRGQPAGAGDLGQRHELVPGLHAERPQLAGRPFPVGPLGGGQSA